MSRRHRGADQTGAADLPPEVAAKLERRATLAGDLEGARAAARAAADSTTAALTAGKGPAVVDAALAKQEGAERRLRALERALEALDAEIPGARYAAARVAAEAFVAAAPAEHASLVSKIATVQATAQERAAQLAATLKDEEALRTDEARLRVGLRLLAAGFDGLGIPALPLPSPRDDVLAEPLRVAARDPKPPRFEVFCTTGALAAERRGAAVTALRHYLDRHPSAMQAEVRRILLLADLPEPEEPPEQRARREQQEQDREAERQRFATAFAGEAARAQTRKGL